MIDFAWKLFSQTGNIETYLLLKELENDPNQPESDNSIEPSELPIDTKM
ncbi:YqzL family protein [Ornithinibacillus sp. L9]|uniref:YqzL family protein n=1 Tax=Ornithinibacillus caprae TaxID=2678566 RepID=A0A6N8FEI9_9BACI|nr:YqzL family protein [Ornithinibacillus caprae]